MASTSRKPLLVAIGLILAAALGIGWRLNVPALFEIGAGYAAEQTCACVFLEKRTLESCRSELEPLARKLVVLRPTETSVTARAGWSTAVAEYREGFGCTLAP